MIPGTANSAHSFWIIFRKQSCILLCSLLFTGLAGSLYGSGDNYTAGAPAAGMGGMGVMRTDFWSVWHNQGGLGFYQQFSAGIHHENRFLVPELALSCLGITLPTSSGTFGLSWSHFGYPRYHEDKIGLALGKQFNKGFSAGLQIDYLNIFIDEETGGSGMVAIEAGILAEPVENLTIGIHLFNPTTSYQKLKKQLLPVILRFGLGYRFDDLLFLGVETEKDLHISKPIYRAGIEYMGFEYIYIRCGLSIQDYVQHSFGMGIILQNFHADLAFSFQQVLGYTPYLSLRYVFN